MKNLASKFMDSAQNGCKMKLKYVPYKMASEKNINSTKLYS